MAAPTPNLQHPHLEEAPPPPYSATVAPQPTPGATLGSSQSVGSLGQPVAEPVRAQPVHGQPWADEVPVLGPDERYLIQLLQYGRMVKIVAIVDLSFSVLNALIHPFATFLVAGPLCGLYGAIRFNNCLMTTYLVFSIVKVIIDVVQVVWVLHLMLRLAEGGLLYPLIIMSVSTVVQAWISRIVYRFRSLLAELSEEKLHDIERTAQNVQARRFVFW